MNNSQISSSVILPKIQPRSLQSSPSEKNKKQFFNNSSMISQGSTLANSSLLHSDISHMRGYSSNKNTPNNWSNKFKLLEVRSELRYTSNQAKNTKNVMKSMSPSLSNKQAFKYQMQQWGKDSSAFKPPIFLCDGEMNGQYEKEMERIEDEKKELSLIKKIDESFEQPVEDHHYKKIVGEEAPANYYKHYKKLDKIQQQNKFFAVEDSTFTSILAASQKKMVTPCKIGLIKTKGSQEDLVIKQFQFPLQQLSNMNNIYSNLKILHQKSIKFLFEKINMRNQFQKLKKKNHLFFK